MSAVPSLRNLEMLAILLQTGSLTATAKLVRLTQPAVSLALKEMEGQFGFALFTRGGRQLVPTPEALSLIPQIEHVLTGVDGLKAQISELHDKRAGHLCFASILALTAAVLPRAVAQFRGERPRIRMEMLVETVAHVLDLVRQGTAELGFVYTAASNVGLASEALMETRLVCVLDQSHPLAAKSAIDLDDLRTGTTILPSAYTTFGTMLRDLARELDGGRHGSIEVNNVFSSIAMVRAGLGIAVLDPLLLCTPHVAGLVARPLEPAIMTRMVMVSNPQQPRSRVAPQFISHVHRAIAVEVETLHSMGIGARAV